MRWSVDFQRYVDIAQTVQGIMPMTSGQILSIDLQNFPSSFSNPEQLDFNKRME